MFGFFVGLLLQGMNPALSLFPSVKAAEPLTCVNEYYDFLANVRSPQEASEALQDFFRPYCQVNDILALQDQLSSLKKGFLSAAMSCQDTSAYRSSYQALLLELYFVRHVPTGDSTLLSSRELKDATALIDSSALRAQMETLFVDQENRLSSEAFNTLFDEWLLRYETRLIEYQGCTEGPWAEVGEKWDHFIDQLSSLNLSLDIEKKSAADLLPNFSAEVEKDAFQAFTPLGQNSSRFLDAIESSLNAKTPPVLTPADLSNSGERLTLDEALNALSSDEVLTNAELEGHERMARYTVLYGYGGALASSQLGTLVQQMNQSLESMNTVDLPSVRDQAAQAYAKQCQ